jgi:FKBP-type peptidyl-prolyl cis-trans isomerase FklB
MRFIFSILFAGILFISASAQQVVMTNQLDSVSYGLGLLLGTSIKNAGISKLNDKILILGINDIISDSQTAFTTEEANNLLNTYMSAIQQQKAVLNLATGKKFLEENAKKEGVKTLPSGLQYKVLKEGMGNSPVDTSTVTVHYTGTFINGKVFDSSVERGQPATFTVNQVIPGWTEALQLMKPGSNWMIYLPSDLGYGENSPQGIEPNSVLIFDVQLISFE